MPKIKKTIEREKKEDLRLSPGLSSLKKWFHICNLSLTDEQYKQLWKYHTLLREKNAEYDLTRLYQFDTMVQKHYIDCIMVAKLLNWELPSPLLDIGTGAGLPAIPLKIACPETQLLLAEGRHKRIKFLREVIEELHLKNIEVIEGKIYPTFHQQVQGVITRAVESIPQTLDRVKNCLVPGGVAIFMKGPHCDEEKKEAIETFGYDYKCMEDIPYAIPKTTHHRRLIIFKRKNSQMKVYQIESPANKIFKLFLSLLHSKGIKKHGQALVFGQKIINEIVDYFPNLCRGVILSPKGPTTLVNEKIPGFQLENSLYKKIDIFDTGADILLVAVPEIKQWNIAEVNKGCTLMLPFQDPENVGSVIRSAFAVGVKDIILLEEAAYPFLPKSIRAGGSSLFHVSYHKGPSIQDIHGFLEKLEKEGTSLFPLAMGGADIRNYRFPEKFILLPGLEGPGLPNNLISHALAIPMESSCDSLNAATATSIALYEWKRKQ